MPAATPNALKNLIKNVIRKFKFEELEHAVLPIFPEISWNNVKSQLIIHHNNLTTLNVATIIEEVINNAELPVTELKERLIRLELIDISRHKRKVWYAYSVSCSNNRPSRLGSIEFKQKVTEELTALTRKNMKVDTVIFNGIMYINIKYVRPDITNTKSNYFALCLGQKYLFSAMKAAPKIFVDTIINNMGFSRSKILHLKGTDLISLIYLLRTKTQGVLNPANIISDPIYRDAEPIIKSTGIDYTQDKQRKNFAEKCFGKSPPILDILVVKGPNCSIGDREIALKLPHNIQSGWEFHSQNIAKFLTTLAERGVLVSPLAPYISNLMSMGRNSLTLVEEK